MALNDAELERQLDAMGATDAQRVIARQIVADQRAAAECEQREEEQERFLLTHLPRYMLRATFAEVEAQQLQAAGTGLDVIEHRIFNGIPRDTASWEFVKRVRELRGDRDGFGRCGVGTQALMAATLDGIDRGTDAARVTFTRIRDEADAFGHNRTADALRAAGWTAEDMSNE